VQHIEDSSSTMLSTLARSNVSDLVALDKSKVASDEQILRLMVEATQERASAYGEAAQFSANLPDMRVLVLVDFDVVVAYIEAEVFREDYGELRFFFEKSEFQYGLPAGAFEELLKYLVKAKLAGKAAMKIIRAIRSGSHEASASLYDAVVAAVSEVENDLSHETNARVCESIIDARITVLDRLLSIITSDRFIGVYSAYNPKTASTIFSIMQRAQVTQRRHGFGRKGHDARSDNNRRDAKNLAIAFYPWETERVSDVDSAVPQHSHLLLLTTTSTVIVTARQLRKLGWAQSYFVSARPAQLFIPAMLGILASRSQSQARAVTLGRGHADATTKLMQLNSTVRKHGTSDAAVTQFTDIVGRLFSDRTARKIEQTRAACLSAPIFFALQFVRDWHSSSLHPRYVSLSRLLERLHVALQKIGGYKYHVNKSTGNVPSCYNEFTVVSKMLGDESADEEHIALIRVFLQDVSLDVRYQVQWEVDVDEVAVAKCLAEDFTQGKYPQIDVTAVTKNGRHVVPPGELSEFGGMSAISLPLLQSILQKKSGEEVLAEAEPIIEIEFSTDEWILVFDVVAPEHRWSRRLTFCFRDVVSADLVRHVYEWTGNFVISASAFQDVLLKLISEEGVRR